MTGEEYLKSINYDESKVPAYTLPDALIDARGHAVSSAFEWANTQRAYVLHRFERYVYGALPPRPDGIRCEVVSQNNDALGGLAIRKEIRIHLSMATGKTHVFDLLLYLPRAKKGPVSAFLGLNFYGNHTVSSEPDIMLSTRWMRPSDQMGVVDNRATESSRGTAVSRWPLELILSRGYALATLYYGDIYPDHGEGARDSIWRLFADTPSPQETAISAWAWGLSRALDCLESEPTIARGRVAVIGHSRLGKTALWAGAQDVRFGLVVSNDSGSAGAAITRRRFGETIGAFPQFGVDYWCVPAFYDYDGREAELPLDQHMLVSLMAPRPVYIASATEDLWADPRGEFLSAVHAAPVYRLFGSAGLGTETMPPADQPIQADLAYHLRTGKHDITAADWSWYLDFADRHFGTTD